MRDEEESKPTVDRISDSDVVMAFRRTLTPESDRGCALIAAAYLDTQLETKFLGKTKKLFVVNSSVNSEGKGHVKVAVMQHETELIELQQILVKAWLTGDRAMVERIIAPEWTSTGPDGRTADRATVLAQVFETRVHQIRDLKIDNVKARVFGDAAVVTGLTHGLGEFEGFDYDVFIRFTDTFVRREGRWQAVASHSSLVQDPG